MYKLTFKSKNNHIYHDSTMLGHYLAGVWEGDGHTKKNKSSGKTTVHITMHKQQKVYAEKLGINLDDLYIAQPDKGEQALEITEHLIRSGAIDIIVVDSVAALVPKAELEGEMGDSRMGLQARLMSQALRKLTGTISKTGCSCIFINQLRENASDEAIQEFVKKIKS